jgi:YebC/PmpR family DNA-binding regulatory protein
MSGHSKWATTKRKKAVIDQKRAKVFTKIIKEIQVAARMGGGDPTGNPRLRVAILAGKAANMPNDNVDRAIKKGCGESGGVDYVEMSFEGYGPGGTAVYVETLTDNHVRTVGEVRHYFSKYGGNMGENGCVSWMFAKKGVLTLDASKTTEEAVMEACLDAGAEDISTEEDTIEVLCPPSALEAVRTSLEAAGLVVDSSEVTMIPSNTVKLEGKQAETCLKLIDALEDNDDVQNVYTNADIPDEILEG